MLQSINRRKTEIIRNRILILKCINSNKMRVIRNMILIPQSVEVARQGSSGIGY
jgi:hypothetical protein